jgi:hypothetical protein
MRLGCKTPSLSSTYTPATAPPPSYSRGRWAERRWGGGVTLWGGWRGKSSARCWRGWQSERGRYCTCAYCLFCSEHVVCP